MRSAWRLGRRSAYATPCLPARSISARRPHAGRRVMLPVQDLLQPLRRHRQLRDRTRDSDRVVDGGRNRRTDPGDTTLACPFDAEWIERARIVLTQDDVDFGSLAGRRHEVISKGRRERIAALIIGEFL